MKFFFGGQFRLSSLALGLFACSSLERSEADLHMRAQGSYVCPQVFDHHSKLKESLAETDATRVRCAKDEWKIRPGRVEFTRFLYQTANCENILGQFTFSAPTQSVKGRLIFTKPKCQIIRISQSWLGENFGQCLFKDLQLHQPYDLATSYPCNNFVPSECYASTHVIHLDFMNELPTSTHAPFTQIQVATVPGTSISTCKRYTHE